MNNKPDVGSATCGCLFLIASGTLVGLFSLFFYALSLIL